MGLTANTDEITRDYFNSIMITPRYLTDNTAELPDTSISLWGREYKTPIMTAALSHLHNICENGMREFAIGAKTAGALHFVGMCEENELDDILSGGADTVKIVKPHADEQVIYDKLKHAIDGGCVAVGMDIDHAVSSAGTYDNVFGLPMLPKTTSQIASYVKACGEVPFIVKGVLSASDAYKSVEAGASAVLVSHHHAMMNSMTPPLFMLPEIVEAVNGKAKIIVDCGFESGMDVFKALALGADGVCIGRNLMGPLKEGGAGVSRRIDEINKELITVMARTGCQKISDIDDSVLRFRSF
ncbi:MAG: alpha-hydroxy-acid oxidizing protein [Clostridia bacterium]|nr:alpha-hydroxy-acid oxidizing protein [Clostridia bacterium]